MPLGLWTRKYHGQFPENRGSVAGVDIDHPSIDGTNDSNTGSVPEGKAAMNEDEAGGG